MCSDVIIFLPRDLKRDVAKKMEKLEKRTQRAIAELIRAWWYQGDGVWGHQLSWRDDTPIVFVGSSEPYCWAGRGSEASFPSQGRSFP